MQPAPFTRPDPAPTTDTPVSTQAAEKGSPRTGATGVLTSNPLSGSQSNISLPQSPSASNTSSNVMLGTGGAVMLIGLLIAAVLITSVEDDTNVWIAYLQSDIDDSVVWSGTGELNNSSLEFDEEKRYTVMLEHGALLDNFSVLSTEGEELFKSMDCKDIKPDDDIEDCEDYTHYHIGNFGGVGDASVSMNATGEVIILDETVLFENIEDTIWDNSLSGLIGGFCIGFGGCCLSIILLISGIITRSN